MTQQERTQVWVELDEQLAANSMPMYLRETVAGVSNAHYYNCRTGKDFPSEAALQRFQRKVRGLNLAKPTMVTRAAIQERLSNDLEWALDQQESADSQVVAIRAALTAVEAI